MLVGAATVAVGVVVAHGVALARRGSSRWWPVPVLAALAASPAAGGREVAALALAAVVAAAVWAFRTRTRLGLATTTLAADPRGVAALGHDPRALAVAHVVAGVLVAAGAAVTAPGVVAAAVAAAAGAAAVVVRAPGRWRARRRPAVVDAAATEPAPLAVDHVVVRDGGAVVLDGLTVLVEPGEVVGVVGPTGAGKSTLVGVVAGTVAPDEGEVRVGGRVALALGEPAAAVVLDEPSAGLEDAAASKLRERIRAAADAGATVLLAEHDMDFAFLTCDRIIAIDRGSAVAAGPPEDVRVHPAVVAAYLGRRLDEVAP